MRRVGGTVVALACLASGARASIQYIVTDLGTLPGLPTSTAAGINNAGQIIGTARTGFGAPEQAFFWSSPGPIQDLGTFVPGGDNIGYGINNSGQSVGSVHEGDGHDYAFISNGAGPMQDLGTGDASAAKAINDSGQVAVNVNNHAFRYGSGVLTDLGSLSATGSITYDTTGINNSGKVVGYQVAIDSAAQTTIFRAFSADGITPMQDLGTLGGGSAWAYAISNNNIVGWANTSNGESHAFLYSGNGPMLDLGTLGGIYSEALGIDANGQIVGDSYTSGGIDHAFLYGGSGPLRDLNDLISPLSGWTLLGANGINSLGEIVGEGVNATGDTHAFLLTPVPEPASLSLLGLSGFLLLTRRATRRFSSHP